MIIEKAIAYASHEMTKGKRINFFGFVSICFWFVWLEMVINKKKKFDLSMLIESRDRVRVGKRLIGVQNCVVYSFIISVCALKMALFITIR